VKAAVSTPSTVQCVHVPWMVVSRRTEQHGVSEVADGGDRQVDVHDGPRKLQ